MQHQAARQVQKHPDDLRDDDSPHGSAAIRRSGRFLPGGGGQRHPGKDELGQRRVDGGHFGVVDPVVPGGAQILERRVGGRVQIGVDAVRGHPPVPQVAVQVVGELGGERQEEHAGQYGGGPDDCDGGPARAGPAGRENARSRVADEGGGGEQQAGKGKRHVAEPPEGGQGGDQPRAEEDDLGGVAVVIPALDEEEALPGVLRALPMGRLHSVVVADNGSTDGTAALARAAGAVVVHEPRRGYGAACLAALARLAGAPVLPGTVVFLDADHPENVPALARLLRPLAEGADLSLGVRILTPHRAGNAHLHARLGNRVVLAVSAWLFGRRFRDLPPFRAIRYEALQRLGMDDRDWGWTLQMQLRAVRARLTIAEVDVPHRARTAGRSKISGRLAMSLRVGATMFRTILRERARKAP